MMAEMFGAREVALGILLYAAKAQLSPKNQKSKDLEKSLGQVSEVKRLLWAGIGVDTFDCVCCTGAFLAGTIDGVTFGLVGGAAFSLVGMQVLSLRGI